MDFSFVPRRLQQTREIIAKEHPYVSDRIVFVKDDRLRKLIMSLVSLKKNKIEVQAYVLSDSEMNMVAGYIPHNYFNVNMENLFRIFSIRSTERLCRILYDQWQESFQNDNCNRFISDALLTDKNMIGLMNRNHLDREQFVDITKRKDIAEGFLERIMEYRSLDRIKLSDRLGWYGIREGSLLYKECSFKFYIYCKRQDYLDISKINLTDIVRKYTNHSQDLLKLFLKNFLTELSIKDLQDFEALADYLQTITGDNVINKNRFQLFFVGFSSFLTQKYIDWMNLFKIKRYFGFDERSRFWKKYRFVSVRKFKKSNAIVMEFKDYYAVEFLGQANGPIYMYTKLYFETKLLSRFSLNDNIQMRQVLLHSSDYKYRKEHRGNWMYSVDSHLRYHNIAEKLDI